MDRFTQQRLEKLLKWADIHSIDDLNIETVGYLTYELEGRVPITQFYVLPDEYRQWRQNHPELVDVEYDASAKRVIIKATTSVLHDTALKAFQDWVSEWCEKINQGGNHGQYCYNTTSSVELQGKYTGGEKQADIGLWKVGSQYPRMVVEVGVDETLREDGHRWLGGTADETNRVILMNIMEENRPAPPPVSRTWGLSAVKLRTISHELLATKILEWHQKHYVPLVGGRIVFDLATLRPGGKITNAVIKAPIPHAGWQVSKPQSARQVLTVKLSSDENDYTFPANPTGYLDLDKLTSELTNAISTELPKERAKKLAWEYIVKREME